MSRFSLFASVAAIACGLSGGARAATFSGSFAVDMTSSAFADPGLVVSVAPTSATGTFELDLGQSVTVNIFDIWTTESAVNKDDLAPETLGVAFALTAPAPGFATVNGTTRGQSMFFGAIQKGALAWDGPAVLSFGDGGALTIALSGGIFNAGIFGLEEGPRHGLDVMATVTYTTAPNEAPAPVPLPAAGAALVAGLGMLGALRRRAG